MSTRTPLTLLAMALTPPHRIGQHAGIGRASVSFVDRRRALSTMGLNYFDIEILRRDDVLVIIVIGEVDLATSPRLEAELVRAEASETRRIVIDLERVTFLDATGLRILARHASPEAHSERVRIQGRSAIVRRLFALTGLDEQLHLKPACNGVE